MSTSAVIYPFFRPARAADDLLSVYAPFFAQDFPLFSGPSEADFAPHRVLIERFVLTGRVKPLADLVEFALETADQRILDAVRGGVPASVPGKERSEAYAQAFQNAMWLTEFALMWARELAEQAPQTRAPLRRILAGPGGPFGFFSFLGGCLGYRKFGVSRFFESTADFLCIERQRLCEELMAPLPSPRWIA